MHRNSMRLMKYFRDKYLPEMKGTHVLDVGAADFNGSYRSLFKNYCYTGYDLIHNQNVDITGPITALYDVIISGQTMEHVKQPWEWLKNLACHFGQYICIIAPNTYKLHRFPIDCYRFWPDGMRSLFQYAGINEIEIFADHNDTIAIGGKHGMPDRLRP